jgi:four helix bundle protein
MRLYLDRSRLIVDSRRFGFSGTSHLGVALVRSYRELLVWQKARRLATAVYVASQAFPRSELYGLTAQIRRAAISVISNIAEGQGRLTRGEFVHFLGQARGSLLEADAQLLVACDLGYLQAADLSRLEEQIYQVLGLLNRLIESLRERSVVSSRP